MVLVVHISKGCVTACEEKTIHLQMAAVSKYGIEAEYFTSKNFVEQVYPVVNHDAEIIIPTLVVGGTSVAETNRLERSKECTSRKIDRTTEVQGRKFKERRAKKAWRSKEHR